MGSTWRYIGRGGGRSERWCGRGMASPLRNRVTSSRIPRPPTLPRKREYPCRSEAQCAFEASHDARSVGARGRRMRRPYIGAPRPVIPEPFVGPSTDGVGMNDSGRGMASPLRNRVTSSRIPRPPPLPRKREYIPAAAKRNAHTKQVMTRAASGLADAACGAPTLVHPDR